MILKIFLIALAVSSAYAAVAIANLPEKPPEFADKEGCYISEIKDVISYGEMITPSASCLGILCQTDRILYETCGALSTNDPKCYQTEIDYSKLYPECCSTIVCDE